MGEMTKQKMTKKIQEIYGISKENAESKSSEILKKCPQKFMQNIHEWVNGETLTDIYADKYSVPMIMAIWGRPDFIGALEVITELLQGDADRAERLIWQMRR